MNTVEHSDGKELAIFAHEVRQPICSILYAVRSMGEGGADKDVNREMCDLVERQALFLARMVENILEVNRCHLGTLRLDTTRMDLGSVIAGAIEATLPLFTARRHRLTVSMPDKELNMVADPVRIQQVVTNLLANAAKYTEPAGSICLRVKATSELVMIDVRDNGIGIPAEQLSRVFDMFEQGSASQQNSLSGLGIGLAVVKSLVELHGGSVSAHSDGLGSGSSFVVRLPTVARGGTRTDAFATVNAPGGRPL